MNNMMSDLYRTSPSASRPSVPDTKEQLKLVKPSELNEEINTSEKSTIIEPVIDLTKSNDISQNPSTPTVKTVR